jgi:hypothetical protein
MSYQEAKYIASFLTTALTAVVYAVIVQRLHASGFFAGSDGSEQTGFAILGLIGAIVLAGILGQIMLAILWTSFGAAIEADEDERDRQIEMRAMQIAFTLLGIGFLGAMFALAWGWTAFLVFHMIAYAMVLAGLAADIYRVWLHRRGF